MRKNRWLIIDGNCYPDQDIVLRCRTRKEARRVYEKASQRLDSLWVARVRRKGELISSPKAYKPTMPIPF